ncbi:hypothetical protein HRI_003913300 [Hibiscus trionum]|uniref:LysM domain-containing protein n=1 Tax=Hibiscus trionum TaxID=183268 RepID=A0A9W7MM49_HIBTR|nr:hypothetical protein HRI_003913300 [Hibiscus trionum]
MVHACTTHNGSRLHGFENARNNEIMTGYSNHARPTEDSLTGLTWKSNEENVLLSGLTDTSSQLFPSSGYYPTFDWMSHKEVPLPCTCFSGTDNGLPAIYLSYVVNPVDTLAGIAASYSTTITDLMNVNAMGSTSIKAGDILAVPLSACASNFPKYAADYGLIVPNGSYAITASHCVQCSCGAGSRNLYCMPSPLAVSCSSMQCKSSNLKLGNVTVQQSSAGFNVTSCAYGGYANGTIITSLSSSLQPRCPGPQQFPPLVAPPTYVRDSVFAPAPAPQSDGTTTNVPKTSTVPSTGSLPGLAPAGAPLGSMSDASTLVNSAATLPAALMIGLLIKLI